jgi:hypothetical protein
VWIFDFARLRYSRSWPALLSMVKVPGPVVLEDGIASERAAFTLAELTGLLGGAGLGGLQHARSRPLGEYQVHWAEGRDGHALSQGRWRDFPLPAGTAGQTRRTRRAFPRSLSGM